MQEFNEFLIFIDQYLGSSSWFVPLLLGTGVFFTFYLKFPQIRYFGFALKVVRGKFDKKDDQGDTSHFQALTTALSGTVGTGNIAGVAFAIHLGGPAALFWMLATAIVGMTTKFVEVTLSHKYREKISDGSMSGGPMYFMKNADFRLFGNKVNLKWVGIMFAFATVLSSFETGSLPQINSISNSMFSSFGIDKMLTGGILAILLGVVIIGGIKRIAQVTEKVVPLMAVMYLLACLYIILSNFSLIDDAFSLIFKEAFNPTAIGVGSLIGVLLVGFQRAAFSNEAGAGSASIAHSAVKTKYSASEGLVALLEPFIDTVVICTMTALVIIIFNFGGFFEYGGDGTGVVLIDGLPYEGAGITSKAFAEYIPYSKVFLTIAVVLFAVSTMISWSYYGLQSWKFLFGRGKRADLIYKVLFCTFVVIGAAASMSSIWSFSDAMIFAMVFPNMIGLYFLFPVVKKQLKRYLDAIKLKREAIEN